MKGETVPVLVKENKIDATGTSSSRVATVPNLKVVKSVMLTAITMIIFGGEWQREHAVRGNEGDCSAFSPTFVGGTIPDGAWWRITTIYLNLM